MWINRRDFLRAAGAGLCPGGAAGTSSLGVSGSR